MFLRGEGGRAREKPMLAIGFSLFLLSVSPEEHVLMVHADKGDQEIKTIEEEANNDNGSQAGQIPGATVVECLA